MDYIHALKCSFDVIAITETWMYQTSGVQYSSIPGYTMLSASELTVEVEMFHCTYKNIVIKGTALAPD